MKTLFILISLFTLTASPDTQVVTRVTGLFSEERVDYLRACLEDVPELRLGEVKLDTASVTFHGVATNTPFHNANHEQLIQRIDQLLKRASNHTFGAAAASPLEPAKLKQIDIDVRGLDCKACAYGAYRAVYRLDGVIQARVSFKTNQATITVEPDKTNESELRDALKKAGVNFPKEPEPEKTP
jgi:copper chaperone CopZ